jgi:putative transposase
VWRPFNPSRRLEETGAGRLPDVFGNGREQMRQQADAEKDELYKQIGQLKVKLDFLKKELDLSLEQRRLCIDPRHPELRVQRQCELLGLPRSTYYYQPRPASAENLRLLRRLDELYMECPFFGSRRMAVILEVHRKRIQRLMGILGIEALYPKTNLSRPAPGLRAPLPATGRAPRVSAREFQQQLLHQDGVGRAY